MGSFASLRGCEKDSACSEQDVIPSGRKGGQARDLSRSQAVDCGRLFTMSGFVGRTIAKRESFQADLIIFLLRRDVKSRSGGCDLRRPFPTLHFPGSLET